MVVWKYSHLAAKLQNLVVSLWQKCLFSMELYLEILNLVILLAGVLFIPHCRLPGLSLFGKAPQMLFSKLFCAPLIPPDGRNRGPGCAEGNDAGRGNLRCVLHRHCSQIGGKVTHVSYKPLISHPAGCWAERWSGPGPGLVTWVVVLWHPTLPRSPLNGQSC